MVRYTPKDRAAEHLGCTVLTIENWMSRGFIHGYRDAARSRRGRRTRRRRPVSAATPAEAAQTLPPLTDAQAARVAALLSLTSEEARG